MRWEPGRVLKNELPESRIAFDPSGVRPLSGLLVDRAIAERRPVPAISDYIREHRDELELRKIDRIEVYLPR